MAKIKKAPSSAPMERAPTILLVEDEPLILMALAGFLQESGFRTFETARAAEAVAIMNANPIGIDLVFSDVKMPGVMDGFGLARWVRQHRPSLPVILCSGNAKKSDAVAQLCADEPFLEKPYDLNFLVSQIRLSLDAKHATD